MPRLGPHALLLIIAFFIAATAPAQPPPGPEEDPPIYDPYPGEPQEDPGSSLDPTFLEYKSTLGEPQEAYDGDPSLLDDPNNYPPEMVGTGPSFGLFTVEDAIAQVPDCKTFQRTGRSVTPIGLSASNPRYLSFHGKSNVYVGWSADAACHHKLNNPDFCHAKIDANPAASPPQAEVPANYPELLTKLRGPVAAAASPQLRKLRLWVSLAGDTNPANVPFQAVGDPATTGYWRLDAGANEEGYNHDYFDRLRTVVNKARQLDLVVEITFFAPFQGKPFNSGPWSFAGNKAKAANAQGALEQVGFSQQEFFAIAGPIDNSVAAARNLRMRDFQRNVILWTIRELWCFENIWYEIANEPEGQTVDPIAVAAWQKTMIDQVEKVEKDYLKTNTNPAGSLQRRHLIAVQPWTVTGANLAFQDSRISIVSSHYTTVLTNSAPTLPSNAQSRLNLGAITLARIYAPKMRSLGFNETKITPLGGGSGDRSHVNGGLQGTSRPDSARAEAWEFLFSQGSTYDNWSYNSKVGATFPVTQQIRDQLVNLQAYFDKLPLDSLEPPPSTSPWVTNIKPYPGDQAPPLLLSDLWETPTGSFRYWAALQTKASVPKKIFLFYNHHSAPRCHKQGSQNVEEDYTSAGCPAGPNAFLSFGSYDARIWSQTQPEKRYQDTFKVSLGTSPGIFDVKWIDPATLTDSSLQVIFWRMTGSACTPPACTICLDPASCSIVSPRYTFDQLLQVAQR